MRAASAFTRIKSSSSRSRLLTSVGFALIGILGAFGTGYALPTLQIIYPRGGSDVEGVVNLRVYAHEGGNINLIDSVKFFRKTIADSATKIPLIRIASLGEWSGSWKAPASLTGPDTLVFRAFNSTGGNTDSTIIVNLVSSGATTPPTITVDSPKGGDTISGIKTISFTATAGGVATIAKREISVDGRAYDSTTTATTHSLNSIQLAEGSHTIRIRITNSAGAATESQVISYFVLNSPTVTWKSPAGGGSVSGKLILDYQDSTLGGASITSDSLLIDGQGFAALKTPKGPDTVAVASLGDGTHTFQIKVTDNNGKTGTSGRMALIVANGPWVTLTSPQGKQLLSGNVALAYHDSLAAPSTRVSDSLLVDGTGHMALSSAGTDVLNSTVLPDGEHSLQVKLTDSRGKIGYSALVTVTVRNGPHADIDSALADSTVSGTLVVRFRTQAVAPATVKTRQISIDGAAFRTTGGDSTDTVDTRTLSEGSHTAQVKVVDSQDKEALSRLVKFNVRNAPSVTVTSPAVDAYASGTLTIRFTAKAVAPDTIKSTQISIGGGEWIAATSDSTYALDTKAFKDGDLRIQIRAVDGSGKSAVTLAREFVIDNSPPKISYPNASYPENAPSARKGVSVLITAQALDLISGMAKDKAVTLRIPDLQSDTVVLHDDGLDGDKVAGDNVYSGFLAVTDSLTGSAAYTIHARDALGNDTSVTGALELDNRAPNLSFALEPAPGGVSGSLSGEVYVSRILMQGQFADSGGSGMKSLNLVVRNDSGDHVNNSPEAVPLLDGRFRRIVELVPGLNRIYLVGMDKAGNVDTVAAAVTYIVPKETKLVTSSGGAVMGADGSGVSIPPGILGQAKEITVKVVDTRLEPKPLDDNIKLLSVPHEFGPDGLVFPSPVTVTLAYTDADLDPNQDGISDFDENKLTLVFWNGTSWIKAGDARVDKAKKTVSVEVNHFTLFDIAQDESAAPSELVAYWDRNPVPGNSEFIYKVPSAGKVSLDILDMSGDVTKSLIRSDSHVTGTGSVRWDGSNVRGLFAGAGLYVYVFKYASDDGKIKKLIRKPVGLVGK